MQEATPATVLGDFDDATFVYGTVRSRFFRRDGRFFVTTDGPDGKLADFEIRYTFGVYPLQQYLIAFPGGRLQALGIAWDARPKEQGGQRWFHLYPGQNVHAGESIHWTGRDQVWNFMCAECHSTDLVKGYDAATDTYETRWAEIDVACEACHGPGSAHVAWAGSYKGSPSQAKAGEDGLTVHFDAHKGMSWTIDPATGNARRSTPIASATELETCGMCHSRRGQIHEPWRPGQQLLDTHLTSLLEPGLFEADGVMVDEVYNYQSFRQSRMFSKGVTCSDCHDPHSLQLHAQGDGVCFQCHEEQKYAAVAHHGHEPGSPGSRCVACHMPARTYMVVDVRARSQLSHPAPGPDRSATASPTPATTATPTRAPPGPTPPSPAGTGPSARAFRPGRPPSAPPGTSSPMRATSWRSCSRTAPRPGSRGPRRSRTWPPTSPPTVCPSSSRGWRPRTRWSAWVPSARCGSCRSRPAGSSRARFWAIRSAACASRR